jgi:hypothetical protein
VKTLKKYIAKVRIKYAISAIDRELISPNIDNFVSSGDKPEEEKLVYRHQLLLLKTDLESMSVDVETGNMPKKDVRNRGLGRIIADAWDEHSMLGNRIISAEQAYMEL